MIYYVIELQTYLEAGSTIPYTFTDRNQAEAKYHDILRAAATSEVPKHGCILMNADAFLLKSEMYTHDIIAE